MTNSTYTLKPIATEIDICWQRQLLGAWHTAGLSDTQRLKMLKLYFGMPEWMDLNKIYPCHRYYEIAQGLKMRNISAFLNTLLRCKGFGLIWKDPEKGRDPQNLFGFYSPLWHIAKETEINGNEEEEQTPQDGTCNPDCRSLDNNNYIKKNYNKKKNYNQYVMTCNPDCSQAEVDKIVAAEATRLFQFFATDDDAYTRIVKPVNEQTERILPNLFTDSSLPHPMNIASTQFFNAYLWPYVLRHSGQLFNSKTLEGRSYWIERLIKLEFMQQNIYRACTDVEQQLARDHLLRIRQNRPLSPHEYQDPDSAQRFYDGSHGAQQKRIPAEAPPRPSATAEWNKFAKEWEEGY